MEISPDFWRRCSSCKKPINYRTKHYVCSVSTCNRKRTGLVFCGVPCWDAHVPVMNHRDAWAEERMSPSFDAWKQEQEREEQSTRGSSSSTPSRATEPAKPPAQVASSRQATAPPARSILRPGPSVAGREPGEPGGEPRTVTTSRGDADMDTREDADDILVVASKLKAYIRTKSGMNTSASVLEVLSDRLRELCDEAIEVARQDGRKTVLDRDFK